MKEHPDRKTRWGTGQRRDPEDARERLIDSAITCYHTHGVHKTVMDDIAAEAQVTRQTVYRHFGGQQAILKAVILRDLECFWFQTSEKIQGSDLHDDYLIELLLSALHYAAENPDRLVAFTPEISSVVTTFLVADSEYELHFVNFLRPRILERAGKATQQIDDGMFVICEWFSRMLASYLSVPSRLSQQPEELRRRFRLLLPQLIRLDDEMVGHRK